jgi:hypothetical protein
LGSSPNPILENAPGLTVFYDEIWFFCESLCPQALREHYKIKYLDEYLNRSDRGDVASRVTSCLTEPIPITGDAANRVCTNNFKDYWKRVQNAGAYWWNELGTGIDNHSHGLEILGTHAGANSNSTVTLRLLVWQHGVPKTSLRTGVCLGRHE